MAKRKKKEENKVVSESIFTIEDEEGKTGEEVETEMDEGLRDEDVYSREGREKLVEESEIEDWEEGFMEGAAQRGRQQCCAYCGKLLGEDKKKVIEREIDEGLFWFCSEAHAEKFVKKKEKQKPKKSGKS